MEAAIRTVCGSGPAERAMRRQLVDAAIVLLAGHFQGCCRELHTEAAGFMAGCVRPAITSNLVHTLLLHQRALSRGNAHPAALAADFARLGVDVWDELGRRNPRNAVRRLRIEQLNVWRNAIAHQDFAFSNSQTATTSGMARDWRSLRIWRHSCSALVHELDAVVKRHLTGLADEPPW
jgi:hypothetical protein